MSVLVMGGTGHVGSVIVEGLVRRGVPVRAVSREPRSWPDGIEGLVADPGAEHGLDDALDGVDGVFLMSGYAAEAGLLERTADLHVVLLSASSATLGDDNAMSAMHHDSEQAVRASAASWTLLRPCSFHSNLLRWRDQLADGDTVQVPYADVPTAMIDPADIGAVAVEALTDPGLRGQILRLSGPEPLTPIDQIALLGDALGRPLVAEPLSDAEAVASAGEPYGEAARSIFRDHGELEGEVQPTVAAVLGRPPSALTAWISANRGAF